MSYLTTISNVFKNIIRSFVPTPEKDMIEGRWVSPWSTTSAGVTIDSNTAMNITAVYAAVKILAETISTIPLHFYSRNDKGKKLERSHPLFRTLHNQPNPWMTSVEYLEFMVGCLCLRGNAYSVISVDRDGNRNLYPIRPDRTEIKVLENGDFVYVYTDNKSQKTSFLKEEIFHVRGLSMDGITGINPVQWNRETLGLAKGVEQFGARYFGNNAKPGGVLTHPQQLDPETRANIKQSWREDFSGENIHQIALLEEGVKWEQIGLNNNDSQFLETRKFQISEIARIYRIPNHMLGDLERATFSNVEQLSLEFVMYTILPWVRKIEKAIWRDLLTRTEQDSYFAEFKLEGLLRGDQKTRYESYSMGRQWGWLSANDIRNFENMNPIANGDTYLSPMNMIPAGSIQEKKSNDESIEMSVNEREEIDQSNLSVNSNSFQNILFCFNGLLINEFDRIQKKEINAIKRSRSKMDNGEFLKWCDDFYSKHNPFVIRSLNTIFSQLKTFWPDSEKSVSEYLKGLSLRYCRNAISEIKNNLTTLDLLLDNWTESRSSNWTENELQRFINYLRSQEG